MIVLFSAILRAKKYINKTKTFKHNGKSFILRARVSYFPEWHANTKNPVQWTYIFCFHPHTALCSRIVEGTSLYMIVYIRTSFIIYKVPCKLCVLDSLYTLLAIAILCILFYSTHIIHIISVAERWAVSMSCALRCCCCCCPSMFIIWISLYDHTSLGGWWRKKQT